MFALGFTKRWKQLPVPGGDGQSGLGNYQCRGTVHRGRGLACKSLAHHSISQYITVYHSIPQYITVYHSIPQYISVYHSIPQYIVV